MCYPSQGWTFDIIADFSSAMNYRKCGLNRLLEGVVEGGVGRLVLTHKDRLLRSGAELVFALCQAKQVEVVIINGAKTPLSKRSLPTMYSRSLPTSPPGGTVAAVAETRS